MYIIYHSFVFYIKIVIDYQHTYLFKINNH